MDIVRLIIIAPYEGLKGLCESIIGEQEDVTADIFTASLEESVKLISEMDISSYDALISRGTTGEMLHKVINIPFIEIETTIPDVMRAVQLAQNSLTRFAFVGFCKLIDQVKLYCEFIQMGAEIYVIDSVEDAEQTIRRLQAAGCLFIIGDGIAVDIAKSLGMGHILITSGAESVRAAIDTAVRFYHMHDDVWLKQRLLETAIDITNNYIIIYGPDQNIVYMRSPGQHMKALDKRLRAQIALVKKQGELRFSEVVGEIEFRVSGKSLRLSGKEYAVFCFWGTVKRLSHNKELYSVESLSDSKLNSNLSLYNSSEVMTAILNNIKNCSGYSLPILISGEPGSGKDTLAYTIYALGPVRSSLFYTIDCAEISGKDWQHLIDSENSPLYENGNCIYLREISALSPGVQNDICAFAKQTLLFSRNHVIASIIRPNGQASENVFSNPLYKLINGLTINIPPLKERINELPGIAACYINEANQQFPTQVIGFEETAMNLLKSFEWPYNIDQLKQVVKELVIMTNGSYITTENTELLLRQHKKTAASELDETYGIDLTRTIDEIEKDIINIILRKNGMNQTTTAKQLGISRGTLWRKLRN